MGHVNDYHLQMGHVHDYHLQMNFFSWYQASTAK